MRFLQTSCDGRNFKWYNNDVYFPTIAITFNLLPNCNARTWSSSSIRLSDWNHFTLFYLYVFLWCRNRKIPDQNHSEVRSSQTIQNRAFLQSRKNNSVGLPIRTRTPRTYFHRPVAREENACRGRGFPEQSLWKCLVLESHSQWGLGLNKVDFSRELWTRIWI